MVVILMYKQNSTNSITQVFTEFGTTGLLYGEATFQNLAKPATLINFGLYRKSSTLNFVKSFTKIP